MVGSGASADMGAAAFMNRMSRPWCVCASLMVDCQRFVQTGPLSDRQHGRAVQPDRMERKKGVECDDQAVPW